MSEDLVTPAEDLEPAAEIPPVQAEPLENVAPVDVTPTIADPIIEPTGDRVIVERAEKKAITRGGLEIPDDARKDMQEGTVVAAGPKVSTVHVGTVIVFGVHAGVEHELPSGRKIWFMREDEIMGIVRPVEH